MLVDHINVSSLELAVFVPALNLGQFLQHLFNCQRSCFDQLASANRTPFALILERPMTVAAKVVTVFTLVNRRVQASLETNWAFESVFQFRHP